MQKVKAWINYWIHPELISDVNVQARVYLLKIIGMFVGVMLVIAMMILVVIYGHKYNEKYPRTEPVSYTEEIDYEP